MFTHSTPLAAIATAAATPIVISVVPAIAASRHRPAGALSGGIRAGRRRSGYGPRDVLVFAEVALASVLVVTALMVFRLFGELHSIRPSYDPTPIAVANIADVSAADLSAMVEQARSVPGVVAVATIKGPLLPIDRARGLFP